jgi:hypothetical protein
MAYKEGEVFIPKKTRRSLLRKMKLLKIRWNLKRIFG